jgi:hypothetical protein
MVKSSAASAHRGQPVREPQGEKASAVRSAEEVGKVAGCFPPKTGMLLKKVRVQFHVAWGRLPGLRMKSACMFPLRLPTPHSF